MKWKLLRKKTQNGTEQPEKPPKKRKFRKRTIAAIIAVCLVLYFVIQSMMPKPPQQVLVSSAQLGSIEQTIETSGTVTTEERKTYYSPIEAKIGECPVKVGDMVKAGDVLLVFDEEDLAVREQKASLEEQEANYTYQDTMNKNAEDSAEYARSSTDVAVLEQQVQDWKESVKAQKQYVTDLGCHLRDALRDGKENYADELQSKIDQANNALAKYQEELADFESDLAEQKGIQTSTKASKLTENGKKLATVKKELASIQAEKIREAAAKLNGGLKAEFGGVVSDVKAVAGSISTEGGELLTVESSESVCIKLSLGRSETEKVQEGQTATATIAGKEYEGVVSRVSRTAVKNEKGASVVEAEIHLENPDESIFLGVDAKVTIHGRQAEQAVLVPMQAIQTDKDGSFVYIVNGENMVEKRRIETGISSMEEVEVLSGLEEGEQVLLDGGTVSEGMKVTPVEG